MTAEQTLLQKRIQDLLDYSDKLSAQYWEVRQFTATPPSVHRIRSIGPTVDIRKGRGSHSRPYQIRRQAEGTTIRK